MMTQPVLALENVRRSYKHDSEALKGVSLAVTTGDVVGLIGRNGAGKTTLLRIAAGILHAHGGTVRVFEMDPWSHPVDVKRRIGYVAESQAIPTHLTVRDLIDLHRDLYPTWDTDLERKLLKKLAVPESSRITALSKGEARKAILLCAIAHRPELLILDEPAGGLDPSARREFLEVSIELLNLEGTSILFSSHHIADVERIAGRVAVIESGQMLFDGEVERLESYCLAVLPPQSADGLDRLRTVDGFVRARKRDTSHCAVFSRSPDEVAARLRELGIPDARCSTAPLEEIFIALVGAES